MVVVVATGLFLMLGVDVLGPPWSLRLKGELLVVFAVVGLPDPPPPISKRGAAWEGKINCIIIFCKNDKDYSYSM